MEEEGPGRKGVRTVKYKFVVDPSDEGWFDKKSLLDDCETNQSDAECDEREDARELL